jgi:CopG family nickel-responsive transcriptional regulator
MERITMSIDQALANDFDALIARRGYGSRSEAMRDLMRREVEGDRIKHDAGAHCVASLSYVYNHHQRDLGERLTAAQHAHHDLVVATMHVHLDHEHCLETSVLKGSTAAVRRFSDQVKAERGVRHTAINLISVEPGDKHIVPSAHHHHGHMHLIPRS